MSTTCQKPDPAPFGIPESISSWIEKNLVQNVFKGDLDHLNMAFAKAMTSGVPQFNDWGVVNTDAFLRFLSGFLTWVPSETCNGKLIYNTQCFVYFVFDQPPLNTSPYQNPIDPTSIGQKFLPLSQFLVDFANEIGSWMGTTNSLTESAIKPLSTRLCTNFRKQRRIRTTTRPSMSYSHVDSKRACVQSVGLQMGTLILTTTA